jgi:hypothetical protein
MATALATYVSNKNAYCAIFGSKRIEMPRANSHPDKRLAKAKIIFDLLAGDLSPENLHCDGEISRAAARAKARKLNTAWKQLEAIIGRHFDEIELYS